MNVDSIASSAFQSDLLPSGERLSSFNPLFWSITGSGSQTSVRNPGKQFHNTEIAIRLYKYMGSFQVAGYTYRGFYSAPMGIDLAQNSLYNPDLSIYGASIRGPRYSRVLFLLNTDSTIHGMAVKVPTHLFRIASINFCSDLNGSSGLTLQQVYSIIMKHTLIIALRQAHFL